jgi:hypothetical protein
VLFTNVRTLTIGAPLERKAKKTMRHLNASGILLGLVLASYASGEGPAKDIGRGAGDVGIGAAKGGGSAAKGTAKGAADVVTLHPIAGATSVGKGAAGAGKDVTVGTVKGTGKVVKGVGKVFKKVL